MGNRRWMSARPRSDPVSKVVIVHLNANPLVNYVAWLPLIQNTVERVGRK